MPGDEQNAPLPKPKADRAPNWAKKVEKAKEAREAVKKAPFEKSPVFGTGEHGRREAKAEWEEKTRRKLGQLLRLAPNWDGYGARSPDPAVLERALRALLEVVPTSAPAPYLVPSPTGGLQIEWHERAGDVEIEFKADGTASFFMETDDQVIEESGPVEEIEELARQRLAPILSRR